MMRQKNISQKLLAGKIKEIAQSNGIDVVGITSPGVFNTYALSDSQRRDPHLTLAKARSIIVAGIYIGGIRLPAWSNHWYARTSRLYLSRYFSDVTGPLEPVRQYLVQKGFRAVICDSSDAERSVIPLKLAAIRAGLGWQGKNSLLISRKYGSYLALGGIITDAELKTDQQVETDHCGNCRRCQEACPISALDQPYKLKKNRCLSYLLQSGYLPEDAISVMENRVGDCEICQDVCPWNRKHLEKPLDTTLTRSFQNDVQMWQEFFHLPELIRISEQEYNEKTAGLNTGISFDLFRRNVRFAIQNAQKTDRMSSGQKTFTESGKGSPDGV